MGIITVIVNHYFDRILMLHACMHALRANQTGIQYNMQYI
jgi:hypothetical protein